MTMLLDSQGNHTAELSVVDRNLDTEEEVKPMTTAHLTLTDRAARSARPHGLSLAVFRLGLALENWARKRAARATLSHEEQARRIATEKAIAAATFIPGGRSTYH
jgi:hypothetical protein